MNPAYDLQAPKKATNLSLNSDLLRRARDFDINLSATLETAVEEALRSCLRDRWLAENREAIRAYNEHVEAAGAFGDDVRSF